MEKKIKLKPCPFCGGMAVLNKEKGRIFSYVKCIVCGAESGLIKVSAEYGSEDKAAEAWNRRVDNENETD